jgi:thymidylate synthase
MWFPEDTGSVHGERVPCTIGYHFMRRGNYLHMVYYIRSCDYLRHFRDDIYMACRKLMWVLDLLKERDPERWGDVVPGYYAMHITSLHCFNKEKEVLKQRNK